MIRELSCCTRLCKKWQRDAFSKGKALVSSRLKLEETETGGGGEASQVFQTLPRDAGLVFFLFSSFVRRHGSIHEASLDKTCSEMKEGRGNLSQVKLADPGERLVH